ncbi:MAG: TIGR01212 family radical SAM protein [Lachnospiraceae bacterium]|nr:TIGR01212 family radical SAM protein [Lachnospiraceae bacterium]
MEHPVKQSLNFINGSWHGKPYYSLDAYCKNIYGEKLYKVALNAGMTCPNRDGTKGDCGCIFCSAGGSGDFAVSLKDDGDSLYTAFPEAKEAERFEAAYRQGISVLSGKKTGRRFIAYFQAYTNTYGPIAYLEKIYRLALDAPLTAGISIATRPDCLPLPVIELLLKLKEEYPSKFIWIELGLQTIHEATAAFIRRGYPLSCFEESVRVLHKAKIPVIVHVILGLPGEGPKEMLSTIHYLNTLPIWGIKLQLLHILKGTDLGLLWEKTPESCGSFSTLELYLEILINAVEHLRPDIVIHRLTGDAPKDLLLFPLWSADKRRVLNTLHKQMNRHGSYQGRYWNEAL